MPFHLARVPLVEKERVVVLDGIEVTLRIYQPVVWVRLVPWVGATHPEAITFPAVLDTGNNHSFLIPATLFRAWTRLDPASFVTKHTVRVLGHELSCHGLNIEVYRMGTMSAHDRRVGRLQTDRGVVVVRESLEAHFPRLPVLGVRCLCASRAIFTVDGGRATYSLRGPD
jgi:hypothetical protein